MLVLTRKRSEEIHIGENIVVKVIRTGRTAVKIGIEAPSHVRVMRAELCDSDRPAPRVDRIDMNDLNQGQVAYACSDQYPHAV